MSLRRADPRFALPRLAGTAALIGDLPGWRDGFEQAGVEVVPGRAELVVAPAGRAAEALALEPELLVLEGGRPAQRLRAAGWSPLVLLPLPEAERPELLLPAGHAAPVRYAVRHWRRGTSTATRARNVLARELLARGLVPPGRRTLTVASRPGGDPFFVAAAREALGVEAIDWFASFGRWAKPFSRGAFFLFTERDPAPPWVLKFARLPGLERLFDDDERGLRLAERSPPVVAGHAPSLVGRFEVQGLHASVETAAQGEAIVAALDSSRPRSEGLAAVERIADWLVRLAKSTAAPADALEPERRRLAEDVVPRWATEGLPQDLVESLPPVPAVFQHGDVFGENVVLDDRGGFTILDWEAAREHGLPLWDLFYFLTRAISVLDGLQTEAEQEEHSVRLWRGELASSELLFRWTRRAVAASEVPLAAVGPLATLLWLSYALLDLDEAAEIEQATGEVQSPPATVAFARRWLSEPGLGPAWDRWR
jgi:Phosphotransferase enzyme family